VARNEPGLTELYKVAPTDVRMELAYLAAMSGQPGVARRGLGQPKPEVIAWNPMSAQMHRVVLAQLAVDEGDAQAAVNQLAPLRTRDDALVAVHATLRRAYAALGRAAEVQAENAWLAAHRGRALAESYGTDGLNAVDLVSTHPIPAQAAAAP
jgi:lipopolysaccharide biosynthesis regulator YciM